MASDRTKIMIVGSWTLFNIIIDFVLTEIALHGTGFYETNMFTNTFGLLTHTLVLIGVVWLVGEYGLRHAGEKNFKTEVAFFLFVLMAIVWTVNNGISIYLLMGVM